MPDVSPSARVDHELFQRYPLTERTLGSETVSFPYHVYNGSVLFMGGTASLAAVKSLLADGQKVVPVQTEDGKALMAVWICDFTDANLGAHQELQIAIFVSARPLPPVPAKPLAILKLISLNPEVKMLCHGIWNSTEKVVAYNRELFGLGAHVANGELDLGGIGKNWSFHFTDAATSQPLVAGSVAVPASQPGNVSSALMRTFGLLNTFKVMRAPYVALQVVNPISDLASEHKAAQTYTKSDKQVIGFFDPAHDTLSISAPLYQQAGFEPQFFSASSGVRFLYLEPQALG